MGGTSSWQLGNHSTVSVIVTLEKKETYKNQNVYV